MSPTQGRKLTILVPPATMKKAFSQPMWEEVREGWAEVSRIKHHPPLHPHNDPTEPTKETGAEYVLGDIVDHIFLMADETLTSFIMN